MSVRKATEIKSRNFQRGNRKKPTLAEKVFAETLTNLNVNFFPQKIVVIKNKFYIVDFLIPSPYGILVEIDGSSHKNKIAYDDKREGEITEKYQCPIWRFTNKEILKDTEKFKRELKIVLDEQKEIFKEIHKKENQQKREIREIEIQKGIEEFGCPLGYLLSLKVCKKNKVRIRKVVRKIRDCSQKAITFPYTRNLPLFLEEAKRKGWLKETAPKTRRILRKAIRTIRTHCIDCIGKSKKEKEEMLNGLLMFEETLKDNAGSIGLGSRNPSGLHLAHL